MNNTFSLDQISKTGNFDSILITRQNKLDLMARFMEVISVNPRVKEDQTAKDLGWSSSTLQRYRQDINMLSTHRLSSNTDKRKRKISNQEHDLERPQITSNDLKKPQLTSKESQK